MRALAGCFGASPSDPEGEEVASWWEPPPLEVVASEPLGPVGRKDGVG
jgi:hypothetical protein